VSTAVSAPSSTAWKIDPSHSHVEFAVRHLMISTVKGRFGGIEGSVRIDEGTPARVDVDVTIDAASIDTREAQRDTHLRSADFFDVEQFPLLTFRASRTAIGSAEAFKLTGDLTIHGVTREITLDVTAEGRGKDPWGGERAGYSATTRIKRSDFGLTWNQVLEAGGIAVGDEIKISVDVELVKQ
jgi:polyisoprenoid-binding protein YceI